jgi:hypothetical protein
MYDRYRLASKYHPFGPEIVNFKYRTRSYLIQRRHNADNGSSLHICLHLINVNTDEIVIADVFQAMR